MIIIDDDICSKFYQIELSLYRNMWIENEHLGSMWIWSISLMYLEKSVSRLSPVIVNNSSWILKLINYYQFWNYQFCSLSILLLINFVIINSVIINFVPYQLWYYQFCTKKDLICLRTVWHRYWEFWVFFKDSKWRALVLDNSKLCYALNYTWKKKTLEKWVRRVGKFWKKHPCCFFFLG